MVNKRCETCTEECPNAATLHDYAKARMYAIKEFIELQKKVDSEQLAEVVRCKDCVFYRDTKDWYGSAYKACHLRADVIIQKRNPDDFCSRGERRCE